MVISEDDETTIVWRMLGYGLTWIQHRSFGKCVPSLSTFPVICEFPDSVYTVFDTGEIQDFQDLLDRGVVHPFSRDYDGESLLHVRPLCVPHRLSSDMVLGRCILRKG